MGLLDGKVTVVTGAGNGIGRATALLFAREGAQVLVNDLGGNRDGSGSAPSAADAVVAEIRRAGGTAEVSYESVATKHGAEAIVDRAISAFGRIDVLLNNAGILRDKTLLKLSLEDWQAVLDVHLTGSFLCTQAAAQKMKEQGSGSIINTTSVSGMLGNFGQSNYAAAKAGIYGLTRTASIELQRFGVRVNAVAPIAKTRLTEDLPMFEKIEESLSAEHVAPAHLFLASPLSHDVTGVVLAVAGGRMSVFKVVESPGKYKEDDAGVWSAHEIADHFESISKV
ncbi:MAG TPA: SDR family NAD(P)-dependent oxidoreductase [Polyangiaceae bacterium]|jgi:NAD(P)-dependent dehydrogenase (short-subunit alcohol dehydrogenase family)|nr:SDR family NAD(P)-dependent oxidoreductase [Polyangiaceae bacterium]